MTLIAARCTAEGRDYGAVVSSTLDKQPSRLANKATCFEELWFWLRAACTCLCIAAASIKILKGKLLGLLLDLPSGGRNSNE